MDYKKEWKLFKKEFNYRDGTFLALIGVLCIALVTKTVEHNNDSYTRVMNCFKDVIEEPKFCKEFYINYIEANE
tara:strand:+ start:804 stop:1025 length:222 start_codon:yes stop_codon:yes gene_type:complete